jgi:hypothetical protein
MRNHKNVTRTIQKKKFHKCNPRCAIIFVGIFHSQIQKKSRQKKKKKKEKKEKKEKKNGEKKARKGGPTARRRALPGQQPARG